MYLHEDTLVRIGLELIAIKDVKEDMKVQSFIPSDRFFYHGVVGHVEKKENIEFWKLAAGKREIIASPECLLITSEGDGYVWRQLKNYRPGELMLIQNISSTVSFHEPIISIEENFKKGDGYRLHLKKYDNFVAEGFPIHNEELPHKKAQFFDF